MTVRLLNRIGPYILGRRGYQFVKDQAKSMLARVRLLRLHKAIRKPIAAPITTEVENYYDRETDAYLSTYGVIIQADRPSSDTDLIRYFSNSMAVRDGMHLLDAGCGVCGPAVGLAKNNNITIEAITISEVQVAKSRQYVAENGLDTCINVTKADYANLAKLYPANTFDLVYFQETLGYAHDLRTVLAGVASVLKQGGSVYIKDFFLVPILNIEQRKVQRDYTEDIRNEYLYRILDLNHLVATLKEVGLFVEFIRHFDIIEDFTIAAGFEVIRNTHTVYTKTLHAPFQIFEVLELKFRKVYPY